MRYDSTLPRSRGCDASATLAPVLTNSERLRTYLIPGSLAMALMNAWKKDDPEAQSRMLTALHDFHKPK